jgi:hypothetical protein
MTIRKNVNDLGTESKTMVRLHKEANAGKTTNSVADAEGLSAINPPPPPPKESDSTEANLQPITHATQSDQSQSLSENLYKQPESSSLAYKQTKDKGDKRQRHYQEPMTEESSYNLGVRNETREHSAIVSLSKPPECLVKQPRPGLRKEENLWSWIPHLRQSVDDKNMVANVRKVFVLAGQYVNNYYVNRPRQELPEDFPPELEGMSFPHLSPHTPIIDLLRQVHYQDTVIKHCLVSIILSTISLDCDSSYPSLLPPEFTQLPKALRQSTALERKIPCKPPSKVLDIMRAHLAHQIYKQHFLHTGSCPTTSAPTSPMINIIFVNGTVQSKK